MITQAFFCALFFALSLAQSDSFCYVDGTPAVGEIFPLTTPYDEVVLNVSLVCNGTLTPSDVTLPDSTTLLPFKFKATEDLSDPARLIVTLKFGCYVEADGQNTTVSITFIDSIGTKYSVDFNLVANIQFEYTLSEYVYPPTLVQLTPVFARANFYSLPNIQLKAVNPDIRSKVRTDLTFLAVIPASDSGVAPYNLTLNPTPLDPQWPAGVDAYFESENDTLIIIVERTRAPEVDNLGWRYVFGVKIVDKISSSYVEKFFGVDLSSGPDEKNCYRTGPAETNIVVTADSGLVPIKCEATCPDNASILDFRYLFDFHRVYAENVDVTDKSLFTMDANLYQDAPLNATYRIVCSFSDSTSNRFEQSFAFTRVSADPTLSPMVINASLNAGAAAPFPGSVIHLDHLSPRYEFSVVAGFPPSSNASAARDFNLTFVFGSFPDRTIAPPKPEYFPPGGCLEWLASPSEFELKFALNPSACTNDDGAPFSAVTLAFSITDRLFFYLPQNLDFHIATPGGAASATPASSTDPDSDGKNKKKKGHGAKVAAAVIIVLLILVGAAVGAAFLVKKKREQTKLAELEQGYTNLQE